MKTRGSTISHYWHNGHRSCATIAHITKVPIRTVKYNIAKIKEQGAVEGGSRTDQLRKINGNDSKALGQWIRRNNEITSNELAQKLFHDRGVSVSRWTV